MEYQELADYLQYVGKDPSTLIFEDELTGIHNRRFLLSYLQHKVDWKGRSDFPLALLSVDLDKFKEINDSRGHEVGDQVLAWLATLLQSVAGDEGLPVRYGGDEFLVVLPGAGRDRASEVAARLLQSTHDRPFRERDTQLVVPVTLSVGIAVAPDDAELPDVLIRAADTALYAAKHGGRDRSVLASDVEEDGGFPEAALQRLKFQGIAGRDEELNAVNRALRGMASGRSQVLVFQGAPGVGKTALLDAVWRDLKADESFFVTKVSGDLKEARRPYYLASRILLDLLNQRGEVGVDLLSNIPVDERGYLAHVLPGLVDEDVPPDVDRRAREGIFTTFTRLFLQAVDDRSVVLLVDDLEFADDATLLLLSEAVARGQVSFTLCGTVGESLRLSGETSPSPVERFFEDSSERMLVTQMVLRPLGPLAIAEYLNTVFPNAQVPRGFEAELVQVTGGNPFFVSAIIQSLLEEGKVKLVGHDWVIEPLDAADLARSLEGIVTEKIAALDQADREILERASTLGEEIPVSILTGSSALDEASVHAFLDRAETLGLVSLDFQVNDEVMRFLGKAILDISYSAIDENRKEELHEEVGQYQEGLFERGLLPSASILAYHFRRSANEAKARRYEQIERAYTNSVFVRREVSSYAVADQPWEVSASDDGDEPNEAGDSAGDDSADGDYTEEIEAGAPLDAQAIGLVPQALRTILSAMRNAQLYPPESMVIVRAMEQTMAALRAILARTGRLTLTYAEGALVANGISLDLSEYRMLETQMLDLLNGAALRAVSLTRDVTVDEVQSLLLTMGTVVPGAIEADFWRRVSREKGFRSVEVRQTQYTRIDSTTGGAQKSREEAALSVSEAAAIPDLIRDLIKTASDVRLYPLGSARVSASIATLLTSLQPILNRRTSLSLARVEHLILVNGQRADVTGWQSVADGLTSFLESLGLSSVTFFSSLSRADLETFFGQLREQGSVRPEPGFWEGFAPEKGLSGIALNQEAYAPEEVRALLASELRAQGARPAPPRGAVADGGRESGTVGPDDADETRIDTRRAMGAGSELAPGGDAGATSWDPDGVSGPALADDAEAMSWDLDEVSELAPPGDAQQPPWASEEGSGLVPPGGAEQAPWASEQGSGLVPPGGAEQAPWASEQGSGLAPPGDAQQPPWASEEGSGLAPPGDAGQAPWSSEEGSGLAPPGDADQAPWASKEGSELSPPADGEPTPWTLDDASQLAPGADVGGTPWAGVGGPEPVIDAPATGEIRVDESVVEIAKRLLIDGKHAELRDLLTRVFSGYERAAVEHRRAKVQTCGGIFRELVIGLQHRLSALALDHLSEAVGTESDPSVLSEATELLYLMAAAAIRFSDYRLAVQLYDVVERRRSDLRARGDAPGSPYAALLDVRIDDHTSQLLVEDLRSGRTDHQARASLVVGRMGVSAVGLLIDVIKQERDLRVRQLAAELLGALRDVAAEQLKETLLTEVLLEHRYRALEVVDLVTKDLRVELAFNIGDENPKIRRAAFQLFERLRRDDFVDLMLPAARADDAAVAKGAIRSLATVGTPQAVQAIIDLLSETEEPILAAACGQALGSLRAERSVEVLGQILSRRTMTRKFHWGEEVRAVAAVALRQIGTAPALAILQEHKSDASMRIREMAQPKRAEP